MNKWINYKLMKQIYENTVRFEVIIAKLGEKHLSDQMSRILIISLLTFQIMNQSYPELFLMTFLNVISLPYY